MSDKNLPALFSLPGIPRKIEPIHAADVIDPLKMLAINPDSAWIALRANPLTCQKLFEKYVVYLAAVPALSGYIGFCLVGNGNMVRGLGLAVLSYFFCLVFMYGATHWAKQSARLFQGRMTLDESAKLVVYSFMPFFLCSIFMAFPPLRTGCLLGICSLYLFFRGLPEMTGMPQGKQYTYCLVNIIAWILFVDFSTSLLFE